MIEESQLAKDLRIHRAFRTTLTKVGIFATNDFSSFLRDVTFEIYLSQGLDYDRGKEASQEAKRPKN